MLTLNLTGAGKGKCAEDIQLKNRADDRGMEDGGRA